MNKQSRWARDAEALVGKFLTDALGTRVLTCTAASRSIGTHIFLSFGELTYTYSRSGFLVPKGEVILALHAYEWRLVCRGDLLLHSETVTDDELAQAFEMHLRARVFPEFQIAHTGSLSLKFDRNIELHVAPHADGPQDDYYETEVEITTRQGQVLDLSLAAESCTVGPN